MAWELESGVPVIGLGLILIAFVLVPFLTGVEIMPLPVTLFIAGSGVFMIWAGLRR